MYLNVIWPRSSPAGVSTVVQIALVKVADSVSVGVQFCQVTVYCGTEINRVGGGGQQKVTICMLSKMKTSPPTSIGSKAACCPFKLHTTCGALLRLRLCCCCQCRMAPMDLAFTITLCFCSIAVAVCADSCVFTNPKRHSGSTFDR